MRVFLHLFVLVFASIAGASTVKVGSHEFRDCAPHSLNSRSELNNCFLDLETAAQPFAMLQRDDQGEILRTQYLAILVHGLSDSAYFWRDIAQDLYFEGISVLAPNLPGHGLYEFADDGRIVDDAGVEQLENVKARSWIAHIDSVVSASSSLSAKLIFGGFSAGGAVATHATFRANDRTAAMILLAPSLKFERTAYLMHKLGDLTGQTPRFIGLKTFGAGVRYSKIPIASVLQLQQLMKETSYDSLIKFDKPLFMALTSSDDAIDPYYAAKVAIESKGPASLVYFQGPDESIRHFSKDSIADLMRRHPDKHIRQYELTQTLGHSSISLSESEPKWTTEGNPYYAAIQHALVEFLHDHLDLD